VIVKPDIALNKKRTRARNIVGPPCENKVRYRSRKQAAGEACRVTRETGERTEHYHCRLYHCWHIGRPTANDLARRA